LCLIHRAGREKFADQQGSGVLSGFLREPLGEGKDVALREIEFEALDAVHWKEEDAGSERLAVADLDDEIVERGKVDAAQAEADRREMENCTPEFFARIAERGDDEGAGAEGTGGLMVGCHGFVTGIVLFDGREMQMEGGEVGCLRRLGVWSAMAIFHQPRTRPAFYQKKDV